MNIQIQVSDDKIDHFSSAAKKELKKQSCRIANEIIDEACRIETTRRLPNTASEVTQSNVNEAATQPKMIFSKKKTGLDTFIQIVAFISSVITGFLFDLDTFTELSFVIGFIVTLFISIATNIYIILKHE